MAGEMFRAKLLHNLLVIVLLIGLLPMSNHMSSMQTMRMDEAVASSMAASQGNVATENTDGKSASPCCDAICPFSLAYAFVVPQSVYVTVYGGSDRIPYSAFIVRSIYLQVASPPPKA